MSASTISTRVVVGQATARRLAQEREAMLANRARVCERQSEVRERELSARGVREAEELAQLAAQRDADAQLASAAQLHTADSALAQAARDGDLTQAREQVAVLRRAAEKAWEDRKRKELVLDEIAARLPSDFEVVGKDVDAARGAPRLRVRIASGNEMPVTAGDYEPDAGAQGVDFGVGDAGISRLVTDRGTLTGCAAEEAMIDHACAEMRDEDFDIERTSTTVARTEPNRAKRAER